MLKKAWLNLQRAWEHFFLSPLARKIKERNLTYLSFRKLQNLEWAIGQASNVNGIYVETGIALGGSGVLIAMQMPAGREFHGYDVFGMIPEPTSRKDDEKSRRRYQNIQAGRSIGLGGDRYYGYTDGLYDQVLATFARFGLPSAERSVALHKGLFEETLHFEEDAEVAFAHIDCDWYDPVRLCLERIYPRLGRRGLVVIDDYFDYGGCRNAVDEFLAIHPDMKVVRAKGNMVMQRLSI